MKTTYYLVFCIVAFAAVFSTASSCKKKKKYCTGGGTCRSVLEAKEFFLFKEGSWWVYEEETTHERDSQYVYEYHNTSGYDFDMRVHSTLEDYNYHYWPSYALGAIETCSESEPVSGKCLYINRSKGKVGDFIGEGNYLVFNYLKGDYFRSFNENFLNNSVYINEDNLQLIYGNFTWNEVIKTHEQCELQENNQATNHYYKKNIGLIRKELLDSNQVWNLVNYHIEQ
jgi:predicted small secreted protein